MSDYRRKAKSALSHAYNYTADMSQTHASANTRLLSEAAALVLGFGLQRMGEEERKLHFMDSVLERLLQSAIAEDDPEKAMMAQKWRDPERAKRPKLLLTVMVHNLKTLAGRMTALFELQYGVIHVVTWKRPTKTLAALVLYTWVCLWPHLVLAYPLLFVVLGVMVPGYLHRHPLRTPEFIAVKRRGQSLLEFFSDTDERSILEEVMDDEEAAERTFEGREAAKAGADAREVDRAEARHEEANNEAGRQQRQGDAAAHASAASDASGRGAGESVAASADAAAEAAAAAPATAAKKTKSHFKSQITLMMNMRDLQNLTTDIIRACDQAEQFWYHTGGFKDEAFSTWVFYGVVAATSGVLVAGPYTPWRQIFIVGGWAAIVMCHPRTAKYLKRVKPAAGAAPAKRATPPATPQRPGAAARPIIIDDSAEVRTVEIFELQRKSIVGDQWSFYLYTSHMFDPRLPERLSGNRPRGVTRLTKVQPPQDWKFDIGYVNEWAVDMAPVEFIRQREIDEGQLRFGRGAESCWIYDKEEDGGSYAFRRRRMSRECYRYSRPAPQPRH